MKKFFKSLMVGLAVIPAAFMFVACGPKDPEDPPTYDKQSNITALNSALDKAKLVGENFTQTLTTNSTGDFASGGISQTAVSGDNGDTYVSLFNGKDFYQEIEGSSIYYIDGVLYFENEDETFGVSPSSTQTPENFSALEIPMPSMGMTAAELAQVFGELQEFAFTTNEEAVVATNNGVTIKIELATLLNRIKTIVANNANNNLKILANALIAEFTGSTEITVDTLLADFETYIEETTIEDMVGAENIEEIKVGVGTIFALIEMMSSLESEEPTIQFFPVGEDENAVAFYSSLAEMALISIESFSSLTIAETLEVIETTLKEMEMIPAEADLTNVADTISELLENTKLVDLISQDGSMGSVVTAQTLSSLINSVNFNKMTATAKLNLVNNAFTGIDLALDIDISVSDGTSMNLNFAGAIEACYELSAVGTTEIELPDNVAINAFSSYLIDIENRTSSGTIVLENINSKILDVITPNGFVTDSVMVEKVEGSDAGEHSYTITISALVVNTLTAESTESNILMLNYSNEGNVLTLIFVVDAEIPTEDPVE